MGTWGHENFRNTGLGNPDLTTIISDFPAKLKQAMYAASQKGFIARKTWNGCAFNKAGLEAENLNIRGIAVASRAFNVTPALVSRFIQTWDSLPGSDEDCTIYLRECIENAGLFNEPGDRPPRIVKFKVYENQEKKLKEQFDKLVENDLVELTDVATEILTMEAV